MSDTFSVLPVTYGSFSIPDFYALGPKAQAKLTTGGLAHFLGNESASKTSTWKKTEEGAAASEAEVEAFRVARMNELFNNLLADTVGSSAHGPRGSAVETVMRKLATEDLQSRCKAANISFPTGDKTVSIVGSDGTAEALTRVQMVDRRLAVHGERLRNEAEAKIAADKRKAEQSVAAAGGANASALFD
jgi:hypothetical protein